MIRNRMTAVLVALAAASPSLFSVSLALGAESTGRTTSTPTAAAREAKVDTLLTISGITAQLDILSNEMVAQFAGPPAQDSKVSDAKVKMEALARKAFPAGRLNQVARESLLLQFDSAVYDYYIAVMNEPLSKRFTAMEAAQIKPGALDEYLKSLQSNPMPASRRQLIEAIDEASHSSQYRIDLTTSIAETMAIASLGTCPTKEQVMLVKNEVSKVKDTITQQSQVNTRITLAYIYRSATDLELASLLKIMRERGHQSVNKWVMDATKRELKAGFAVMAEAVSAMAAAANKQKSVFARRSCDGKSLLPPPGYARSTVSPTVRAPSSLAATEQAKTAVEGLAKQAKAASPAKVRVIGVAPAESSFKEASTPVVDVEQASKVAKLRRSRTSMDARECLQYEDIKKVMVCAERFR